MRAFVAWFGALFATSVLSIYVESSARGDEPVKPTAPASETNPAVPAAGHSVHGEAFNDGPRHAAYLMPGMGKIHFPITTKKSEAQAFMDQGVGQIHSFYYLEAERSFRQAAQIDPACGMAYWGMAMANINNPKRAQGFLKEARKRASGLGRHELLYLEALESFFKEGANAKTKRQGWLQGLETIVQEFPGDIDARAWLAMVTWQNSMDGIGSRQAVDTLLDTVLQVEPMHPGAIITAFTFGTVSNRFAPRNRPPFMPGPRRDRARLAHAGPHLHRAEAICRRRLSTGGLGPCRPCLHDPRPRDALRDSQLRAQQPVAVHEPQPYRPGARRHCRGANLVEQPRDPQKNGPNDGGSPQRSGRARWAELLTRYELWDELIEATTSGALDWSNIPHEQEQKAYTLGLAYAAKNDQVKLAEQIGALKKQTSAGAKTALAELEGLQLLARGDIGPAFEQFAKATSMRPEALARAHLAARNYGFAETNARQAVEKNPNQVPALAAQVEILHACGKDKEAREAYKALEPMARWADRDLPVFRRLDGVVSRWKAEGTWTGSAPEPANASGSDETVINRIDVKTLGPLVWSPFPAETFTRTDTTGAPWNLANLKGKNVLIIFFLGGKCAHCMQQLQTFGKEYEALKKLNVETVAIGSDDLDASKALKNNNDGIKFPMAVLPDPKLELFKLYRSFDDFEGQPLHGTFLIDTLGNVRFQRISADPFLDVEFIKGEATRVNRLLGQNKR